MKRIQYNIRKKYKQEKCGGQRFATGTPAQDQFTKFKDIPVTSNLQPILKERFLFVYQSKNENDKLYETDDDERVDELVYESTDTIKKSKLAADGSQLRRFIWGNLDLEFRGEGEGKWEWAETDKQNCLSRGIAL